MILSLILLIIGFIVLIKGADYFVEGASNLAGHLKLSKVLVGLTIVAFGTSAPELAVSIQSMLSDSSEIVLGNVIGSNITNILLILGISSLWGGISVSGNTLKKEMPMLILLTALLSILYFDTLFTGSVNNVISRSDGIVIILFFLVFLYYLFTSLKNKNNDEADEADEPELNLPISFFYIVGGLVAVIISSDLVVSEAINIAEYLGVSQRMISLTVIAFGTSLPELATGITAAKKRETDILLGNVIGSNIFNICIVLGIPVAIFGGINYADFSYIDFSVFFISSVLIYLFACFGKKIKVYEGIILLILYLFYYAFIMM